VANNGSVGASDRQAMIADLQELIQALDQRVPRLERSGERQIAQEAAELRDKAVTRIEQIKQSAGP
jgi:hypothetical protein